MLKTIRKLLGGISQEEFARRIGVSVNTVNRWEKGKHPATLTIRQAKLLDQELRTIGLSLQDIPDTLGPLEA